MKTILDIRINKKLENEDILVYRDGIWTNIPKDEYLAPLRNRIIELQDSINDLTNDVQQFKERVNQKLQEYHNILQVLTEEE